MKRVQQQYLGLLGPEELHEDDAYLPVRRVLINPGARHELMRRTELTGRWQGGTLFGSLQKDQLSVQYVAPLAPPGPCTDLLQPHLPYLLGWSDSLSMLAGLQIDWCGNWLMAPDGLLTDDSTGLSWLEAGARQGLIDDRHVLLLFGRHQGGLRVRAYRYDDEPVKIDCIERPII